LLAIVNIPFLDVLISHTCFSDNNPLTLDVYAISV